ncbi:MAG: hypothetical protein NTW86_08640, partial [Candidatus Sumerlaeota bacterium]|nr:hypothetical protein [Candidatus Sumerlaeota bacterium]
RVRRLFATPPETVDTPEAADLNTPAPALYSTSIPRRTPRTMFLLLKDGVLDFDLDLLVELLAVIDHQIERIEDEISRSPDPDGLGHFDRMEGVIGLGFVACQQYIHATYPQLRVKNKSEAIQAAPKHSSGRSVTEVINAAANFWKHHDEWPGIKQKNAEEKTRAVINSLVPSSADYVMGNVLYELLQPQAPRFASVVHLLTQWRDLLIVATA